MSSFRIPLVWQMYGHVDVEADTLDDAIEYALGPDCPLPEGEYVDDSIQVDDLVLNQEATHESHQFEVGQQYYALVSKEVLVVSEVLQPGMYPSGSGGYHTLRSPMVRFRSEKTGLVHTCSLELAKHLLLAKRQTAKEKGVG